MTDPLVKISSKHSQSQNKRARELVGGGSVLFLNLCIIETERLKGFVFSISVIVIEKGSPWLYLFIKIYIVHSPIKFDLPAGV